MQQDLDILKYAAAELKGDREFVLAAVQQDGYALQCASAEFKEDREIVLAAVQQDGYALKYASAELKGDREVVLAAVQQYGYALEYAAVELKGDREIVLAAVQQNGYALVFASETLQGSKILKGLNPTKLAKKRLAWAMALKTEGFDLCTDIIRLINDKLLKSNIGDLFNVLLEHIKKEQELSAGEGLSEKGIDEE